MRLRAVSTRSCSGGGPTIALPRHQIVIWRQSLKYARQHNHLVAMTTLFWIVHRHISLVLFSGLFICIFLVIRVLKVVIQWVSALQGATEVSVDIERPSPGIAWHHLSFLLVTCAFWYFLRHRDEFPKTFAHNRSRIAFRSPVEASPELILMALAP